MTKMIYEYCEAYGSEGICGDTSSKKCSEIEKCRFKDGVKSLLRRIQDGKQTIIPGKCLIDERVNFILNHEELKKHGKY